MWQLDVNTGIEKRGRVQDTLLHKKTLLTHRVLGKPSRSGGDSALWAAQEVERPFSTVSPAWGHGGLIHRPWPRTSSCHIEEVYCLTESTIWVSRGLTSLGTLNGMWGLAVCWEVLGFPPPSCSNRVPALSLPV